MATIAMWHSERGCSPGSWVDQIGGRVLLASSNQPIVGPDGAYFKGKPVAQCASPASPEAIKNRWYRAVGTTPVGGPGTRPYSFVVARLRNVVVGQVFTLRSLSISGVYINHIAVDMTAPPAVNYRAHQSGMPIVVSAVPGDTQPRIFEQWNEVGSVKIGVSGNDTAGTTASDTSIGQGLPDIAIGCEGNAPAGSAPGDWSVALMIVCMSVPTAAERTALQDYARSYWGVI